MLHGLVVLLEVGVGVAQCAFCCGTDHLVALGAEVLQCVCGFLPLAEVGLAEADVELGEVAGLGGGIVAGHLLEADQCLLELFVVEELLALGQLRAGCVFARNEIVIVGKDAAYDEYDNCHYTDDDSLLVCLEECCGLVYVLLGLCSHCLVLLCHYLILLFLLAFWVLAHG